MNAITQEYRNTFAAMSNEALSRELSRLCAIQPKVTGAGQSWNNFLIKLVAQALDYPPSMFA